MFYDELGVAVRAWAYAEMLPVRAVTADLWTAGAPGIERLAVRYGYPVLAAVMRKALRITPTTSRQALAEVDRGFDEVEALLGDGRCYLAGDALTAADLTLAALVGPAVLPTGYGGPLPTSEELPAGMAVDHERLRNRVAGPTSSASTGRTALVPNRGRAPSARALSRGGGKADGLVGQRDPALEALYLYRDLSGYFVRNNQNPVRCVN